MGDKKDMKKMVLMLVFVILILSSGFYAFKGAKMHSKVDVEEDKFHELQSQYWSLSKASRDSALTNSELNNQLVEIKNYPSELLKLKLVGVGKILLGIYILLFGILIALMMMPIRLGEIIKKK